MRYWYQKPHRELVDYVRSVLVADMLADDQDPNTQAGKTSFVKQFQQHERKNHTLSLV